MQKYAKKETLTNQYPQTLTGGEGLRVLCNLNKDLIIEVFLEAEQLSLHLIRRLFHETLQMLD